MVGVSIYKRKKIVSQIRCAKNVRRSAVSENYSYVQCRYKIGYIVFPHNIKYYINIASRYVFGPHTLITKTE